MARQNASVPADTPRVTTDTVIVTRHGRRFKVAFSRHPGHTFGPWDLTETVRDLTISALLAPADARDLVLDALANGSATSPVAD